MPRMALQEARLSKTRRRARCGLGQWCGIWEAPGPEKFAPDLSQHMLLPNYLMCFETILILQNGEGGRSSFNGLT